MLSSAAATRAHRPEVCYPAQGFNLRRNEPAELATAFGRVPVRGEDELAETARAFNRMADMLSDHTRILEETVRQRTLDLQDALREREAANDHLQRLNFALEAEKVKAQEASVAKSQFLAVMSHEIRTPINGVLGSLQLALRCPLDEGLRQHLETASSSGQLLRQIELVELHPVALHFAVVDPLHGAGQVVGLLLICGFGFVWVLLGCC